MSVAAETRDDCFNLLAPPLREERRLEVIESSYVRPSCRVWGAKLAKNSEQLIDLAVSGEEWCVVHLVGGKRACEKNGMGGGSTVCVCV